MRVALFLTIVILSGTAGEIAVSHAMKGLGEVHDFSPRFILSVVLRAAANLWVWLGICLMAVAFFALLALLSWENVSFVVPATALSYVVGALGAKFLLGEKVDFARWIGVVLVCVGVALVWAG